QTPQTPATAQDRDEVIRISTEIVQTDVMVFDRSGKFIEGLRPEDFDLRVDGRPQRIEFFERIQAGSVDEDAQLRAARGGGVGTVRAASPKDAGKSLPLDRGRVIFFFVDDMHLSAGSAGRLHKMLMRFVDEEMGQNDQAAFASTTGQIGFLQQLTGDKVVLRAAVNRIRHRPYNVKDMETPAMTEAQALAIDQNNPSVIDWFVRQITRENPMISPELARNMVESRSRALLQQASYITGQTLRTLENLVRGTAQLSARKIVFFVSDGFHIDRRNSDTQHHLQRIADAASRAGAVIYSMDARGLSNDFSDASVKGQFDPEGQLVSTQFDTGASLQEPLRTLAAETGGRALLNTNALGSAVTRSLEETSRYYLLAWRPEDTRARDSKQRRLEVSVRGRPELNVMMRRGYFLTQPAAPSSERAERKKQRAEPEPKTPPADAELFEALRATYPRDSLPTSLALAYVNAGKDTMVLTAALEIDGDQLTYKDEGGTRGAIADLAGAVYDDRGKVVTTLRQELGVLPPLAEVASRQRVVQSYQFRLAPGLYQVRFAARDRGSKRLGSAMQWVEIPDPKKRSFSLSSIFVGERVPSEAPPAAADEGPDAALMRGVTMTADRRLARTSWLRFVTFIYNAANSPVPADVVLQVQVFRDDQPVLTTPLRKIETRDVPDIARIPYAAEIPLSTFPVGHYVLQVTAIDRAAKASASQRINFSVE
ncbi:MAG TPA: VWA domain-containing protein, partial [Pyrinomonadaceae bacterium]